MQEEYRDTNIEWEAKTIYSRLGFAFATFAGVTFLTQLLIAVLWNWGILPFDIRNMNISLVLSMVSMYAVGFPVCYLIFRRIPCSGKIEKRKLTAGYLAVVFLICISILYLGNFIGQALMRFVGFITGETPVNNVLELVMNANPLIIFLATVVAAPVTEELIYRKLLINRTLRYGQRISVVLSGVLFGLAHGNFYQFFYACALGMIFAYLYVKTNKIIYPIIFHMIINFLGSIFPLLLLKLMKTYVIAGTVVTAAWGMLIIGSIISGIVLLLVYRRQIVFDPGIEQIPKGRRFRTICFNTGMVVYLAVCIITFVWG